MLKVLENDPLAALGQRRPRWLSGIVGGARPSRYSKSPALWNTLFGKLGLDAAFVAFDLPRAEDMSTFLKAFLDEPGALDLTVTNPYKATAWKALSSLAPAHGWSLAASYRVEVLGCLNHLIVDRECGRLVADNTDGVGMLRALEAALGPVRTGGVPQTQRLAGQRALVVGAGGAGAAIGLELVRSGVDLTLVDIAATDARALAERLAPYAAIPIGSGDWSLISRVAPRCGIIISAISAGSPLGAADIARLPADTLFADTRYGATAEFARAAGEAGRSSNGRVIDGQAMLFGQFVAAAALACPIAGVKIESLEQAVAEMEGR